MAYGSKEGPSATARLVSASMMETASCRGKRYENITLKVSVNAILQCKARLVVHRGPLVGWGLCIQTGRAQHHCEAGERLHDRYSILQAVTTRNHTPSDAEIYRAATVQAFGTTPQRQQKG